jgi:cytochrome c oxidase subunit 2
MSRLFRRVSPLFAALWACLPAVAVADAPEPWQMGFQDPATPIMEGIIDLHHDIMFFIVAVGVFVFWMLARVLWRFRASRPGLPEKLIHGTVIEIVWTLTPSFILLAIAVPSFALLYSVDEVVDPAITVKAIGHQWYWSYEYSDYTEGDDASIAFDSYMVADDDLAPGAARLLETDRHVVVPVDTHVRVIITAADVLHSWAVPSLGVKCDAVPGRLNQVGVLVKRPGLFYGQCSELCGANHAFMPIVVEAVSMEQYHAWLADQLADV